MYSVDEQNDAKTWQISVWESEEELFGLRSLAYVLTDYVSAAIDMSPTVNN